MPYSSPQPSSVQWQPQTRIRSAPHSPTLRPRTTPPESAEDLSFPVFGTEENSFVQSNSFKTPGSVPVAIVGTGFPSVKALPRPAPQRIHPQSSPDSLGSPTSSPTGSPPPKLPVSNASATKARTGKDRTQLSTSPPSLVPKAPEKSKPVSGTTVTLISNEDCMPEIDKPLDNGVKKPATATTNADNTLTNGVSKTQVEAPQKPKAARPTANPLATAVRHSEQADSASDDIDKVAIVTANAVGSSQTPEAGPRKSNPVKGFVLRILSCCNRDRF